MNDLGPEGKQSLSYKRTLKEADPFSIAKQKAGLRYVREEEKIVCKVNGKVGMSDRLS